MNSLRVSRALEEMTPIQRALDKLVRLQWWLLFCLGVAGGVSYFRQPIADPVELRGLVAEARTKKEALTAQRDKLLQRIDWLKTEPEYLEIAAQDKLGRTRAGEQVVRFK